MTLDLGNTDKLNGFRQELDRIGVRVLPPDINALRRRVRRRDRCRRQGRHPLCAGRAEECRPAGHEGAGRRARGRTAAMPASATSPGASTPRSSTSARWKAWSRPARSTRSTATAASFSRASTSSCATPPRRRRSAAAPRPISSAAAATDPRPRPIWRCPRCPTGCSRTACARNSRRSASISRRTRSKPMRTGSAAWA